MQVTKRLIASPLGSGEYLLINGATAAADVVTRTVGDALMAGKLDSLPAGIVDQLTRRGYVVPEENAEDRLEQLTSAMEAAARRGPALYVICPTYQCNLRCPYCFEAGGGALPRGLMTPETVDRAFAAVEELHGDCKQEPSIQLFGGEPLLSPASHPTARVLENCGARGWQLNIVTNGVNVGRFLPLLRQHRDVIHYLQITLDGPPDHHDPRRPFASGKGTFLPIIRGIDQLLKDGFRVHVRVNLDLENLEGLPRLARVLRRRGWPERENFLVQVAPVVDHLAPDPLPRHLRSDLLVSGLLDLFAAHPESRALFGFPAIGVYEHLLKILAPGNSRKTHPRLWFCETNVGKSYVFSPDGSIHVCTETVARADLAIGRFLPKLKLNLEAQSRWEGRSIFNLEECRECPIATFCGGGCAYEAVVFHGSPSKPACRGRREEVAGFLAREGDRLLNLNHEDSRTVSGAG